MQHTESSLLWLVRGREGEGGKKKGGEERERKIEVNKKGWILANKEFGIHPVSNGKPLGGFKPWRGGIDELTGWIKETD